MDEGVTQLPDRVLDAVLDQLPATPQRRVTWWPARRPQTMNTMLKFGLAAVVVAVAALIGINYLGSSNVGGPGIDSSTPTEAATPTLEPTPLPLPEGNLSAGETFSLSLPQYPVDITVTIPAAGWDGDVGAGILTKEGADPPGGAGIITFVDSGYFVYGDPCQWSTTRPDAPATTVDELVAALSAQASRDASAPVDITLDGYAGKAITLHVPHDVDFADCDESRFASWGVPGEDPARWHQGPGQIDNVWILDVDGNLVVIDWAHYPETTQDVVDEVTAIVESATFSEQP
jgi:hypothetical protein